MAKLSITRRHQLSQASAKEAADQVAQDLRARFNLAYAWEGDAITFARPGLTGRLTIAAKEVRIDAELGFLLSALRPAIERQIHEEFERRFGPGDVA